MTDIERAHVEALASLTPAQVQAVGWALERRQAARIQRWRRGGHERDHLRNLFSEATEAEAVAAG